MKVYIIIENNLEDYDDYREWIEEVYSDKEKVEKRLIELVKNNHYKKDRLDNIEDFYKRQEVDGNVGAYRLEEHEVLE